MIVVKSDEELATMRLAGQATAKVCHQVSRHITPGMTTRDIDHYAGEVMAGLGVKSAFLGYRGYPGNICVSVNEVVVHGLPGERRISAGDIVSLDLGVIVDGFMGDMAVTLPIEVDDPALLNLLTITEKALYAGIAQAKVGYRLGNVSYAIESTADQAGLGIVRDFVGHGIGRDMHEEPQIPNYGSPGKGPLLRRGMTLAIEPMFNLGLDSVEILDDGWTVVTKDRRPSAHFEHTIAILDTGAEILTKLDQDV